MAVNIIGLIFVFVIILVTRKTKDYKLAGIILSIGTLIIIPARAYNGGGVHTAVLVLYVVHNTLMFALFGRKVGLWFLLIDSLSIFGISYFPTTHMLHNTQAFAIMLILMLSVNTISIIIILNSKDGLTRRLRQYEQAASSNLIMSRLSHEIFNAITIIMLRLKNKKHTEEFPHIYEKLNEIIEIIQRMHEFTKDEALIEILKKYENDVKLLDKLKNDPPTSQQ